VERRRARSKRMIGTAVRHCIREKVGLDILASPER
jgi:hypothetical protein